VIPLEPPPIDATLELGSDLDPLLGDEAAVRLYGRFATVLDPGGAALRNAMAHAALLVGPDGAIPVRRGIRRNTVRADLATAIHALREVPLGIWHVAPSGGDVLLGDAIGLEARWQPRASVRVWGPAGGPGVNSQLWCCRVLPTASGTWAVWPMALPEGADVAAARRVAKELAKGGSVGHALALRGDVACRAACEGAWKPSG
jgi:hypothetical protein